MSVDMLSSPSGSIVHKRMMEPFAYAVVCFLSRYTLPAEVLGLPFLTPLKKTQGNSSTEHLCVCHLRKRISQSLQNKYFHPEQP